MKIQPYLNFNGDCASAFDLYARVLGGKITAMITHADSPMAGQVAPEWQGRIMHARLEVGDQVLMASDVPPEHFESARGTYVSITVPTPEEAERIFSGLSEGARRIQMAMAPTFWSVRFGMLVDRFGTPWMVDCDQKP